MVAKTVKASFPSNLERTVASALLLLSSSPSSKGGNCCSSESFESSEFSSTKSEGGSSTAEASVGGESSRDQQLTVVAFVPGFHELKLKIVQKKRSKSIWISNIKKTETSKPEPISAPVSTDSPSEASSSLSSSSNVQSFSTETNAANKLRKPVIPGHMGRKAAAILKVLSNGSASEVRIRQLLGDSPSTSKALRMLLKLQEVKRFGAGGRTDPYIYMIAS